MELQWVQSALEALLFASGEPVTAAQLAQALDMDAATVEHLLADMQAAWDGPAHGVQLLRLEDRWQMATKNAFSGPIKRLLDTRRNTPLTPAALEVLAIVAYNQPVSRAFVDQIRGVDSASPVQTLLARDLIAEAGRLDLPGRPVAFRTTDTFLRCFGLDSLEQLPPLHPPEDAAGEAPADGAPEGETQPQEL